MTTQTRIANTDLQRHAYNAAFYELGLGWHWDSDTFERLLPIVCKTERVRQYMMSHQPHLLHAYDADFLTGAIETTQSHCLDRMMDCRLNGTQGARTVNDLPVDWAALHSRQIGA